ncbi:MAG TPA: homoserine O-succinyltransferase [Clostridia bacterium]|jgi:homoserine O-succinyltransferase|nr:homoserine O-succinyltransferase [Clostridia bacterium]
MPIIIPQKLPAVETLLKENIFVMTECRALRQDIRPLQIALVNLMPTKIVTETQFLRLMSNFPIQIEVDFIHTKTHKSANTPEEHLISFYKTLDDVRGKKYDGMIITGAPVEHLDFEEVEYWGELKEIMDYSVDNVTSTLHVCWGAQAGLYHHYGIPKYMLPKKMFGVFPHYVVRKNTDLLRGFDDQFFVPHSRYSEVREEDIRKIPDLEILAVSPQAGIYLVASKDGRQIFVTGHSEYDPFTLQAEYERDVAKGIEIDLPQNYYPNDDPTQEPIVKWRGHANLFFSNWLNYYVYQVTPYDLNQISSRFSRQKIARVAVS